MNVVGTSDGKFVEVQGTGEESTFSYDELQALLDMSRNGLAQLAEMQAAVLDDIV
jgi:ribonuclease PH